MAHSRARYTCARLWNDLHSLVGFLLLRARMAPSDAARDGLREAAEHAMALARVHTRLVSDGASGDEAVSVDTREFAVGLCADIEAALVGKGLRPVALVAKAEAYALDNERAVQLGLALNETVTNAFLKYAFPEDRPGTVLVRFAREGGVFVMPWSLRRWIVAAGSGTLDPRWTSHPRSRP